MPPLRSLTVALVLTTVATAMGCTSDAEPGPHEGPRGEPPTATIASPLSVGKTFALVRATVAGPQSHPCVSWAGPHYLAAWADGRAGGAHLYARRLDALGAMLDDDGVRLTEEPLDGVGPSASACLATGVGWVVAWSSGGDVRVRPVSLDGKPGEPVVIAKGAGTSGAIALGRVGGSPVILWRDDREVLPRIFLARLDAAGKPTGGEPVLLGLGARPIGVASNFGATALWVGTKGLMGATLDGSLRPKALPPSNLAGSQIAVATSGGPLLASYVDSVGELRVVPLDGSLTMTSAGVTLSPPVIAASAPPVFDGRKLVFAWSGPGSSIELARRSALGVILDAPPIVVRTGPMEHPQLAMASSGGRRSLVVFTEQEPGDPSTARVQGVVIDSWGGLGDPCTSEAECESGHCVDSVCCDSACTGACQRCLSGSCRIVRGAARPGRCPSSGDVCRPIVCDGTSADTCVQVVSPRVFCRMPKCDGEALDNGATCSTDGRCVDRDPATTSCVPYRCNGPGACFFRCTTDAQCAEGHGCHDGKCVLTDWLRKLEPLKSDCGCRVVGGSGGSSADLGPWLSLGLLLAIKWYRGAQRPTPLRRS